jgi:acyl-CoA hydrolase
MSRIVHPNETACISTHIIMPSQSNALGTVFGGQIMAWIDVCAAISAQRFARATVVTAAMDQLMFRAPIRHGEIAVLQSQVNWAGTSSMEIGVRVEGEEPITGVRTHTSTAYLTFVALDEHGAKVSLPTLVPQTAEDKQRWDQALERRKQRLSARERDRRRRGQ